MPIKVKAQHAKTVVGFNNSGKALGERDDLHLLLNDAISKDGKIRDQSIVDLFESVPTRKEIDELMTNSALQKAAKVKEASNVPK